MLSDADLERYARQVIMPDMGEAGQEALLAGLTHIRHDHLPGIAF